MARSLLLRGMLVGVLAGVLAFLVARLLGESDVSAAIALESAHHAAEGGAAEAEPVSRSVQSTLGLLTATTVYGAGLGGAFGLAYGLLQGRLGRLGARATSALTALGGFLALGLLPALKYPANPPSVGSADTIGRRTTLYLAVVLLSLAVVVSVGLLVQALTRRGWGLWDAWSVSLGAGLLAVAVAYAWMPVVDEVPADFPADLLWDFRLASLAVSLALWAALGLVFGGLTERALADHRTRRALPQRVRA